MPRIGDLFPDGNPYFETAADKAAREQQQHQLAEVSDKLIALYQERDQINAEQRSQEEIDRGKERSEWVHAQMEVKEWTSYQEIARNHGPSYNTIQRYLSGKPSTRDASVRADLAKAFGRKRVEVPK